MKRDLDSTLARMAGNIAPGLITRHTDDRGFTVAYDDEANREAVAEAAVDIAKRILARCKADYAALPTEGNNELS